MRVPIPRTRHRRVAYLTVAVSALVLAISAGVATSGNFDTYYCGTATTYCTLGSGSYESTVSTALRDNNYVHCEFNCHAHVWYADAAGAFDITHTNGTQDANIGIGSGSYSYSRCETDSGFGSNQARCHTPWHT